MKKITLFLAAIMVFTMIVSLNVSASNKYADVAKISSQEIKKGSPVIDGFYDRIYDQGACIELKDCEPFYGNWLGQPTLNAKFNFLWDDEYFYMFAAVQDETVTSSGDKYIQENGTSAWINDAIETWFIFDEEYCCKVHNDAYGKVMFVSPSNKSGLTAAELFDASKSKFKCTPDAANNQYTIEVAFKPTAEYAKYIAAGKQFNFAVQVNNVPDETHELVAAYGGQQNEAIAGDPFTFSSAEVEVPADDTPTGGDEPADDTPVNPNPPVTADAGIIAAVAVMAVAAGIILTKKH